MPELPHSGVTAVALGGPERSAPAEALAGAGGAEDEATPAQAPQFVAPDIFNPPPGYPEGARRLGQAGLVRLAVRGTPEGRAEAVTVAVSSGHSQLDQAAQATMLDWRFLPARQGERPVVGSVSVPIRFVLGG